MDYTSSTNEYTQALLKTEKIPEGTVIFTTNQTKGKGHYGSEWISEPGKNLACSIVLHPNFLQVENQFNLNIAISLAVYDLLRKHLKENVSIKWPNDIYYLNYKLCGILIENTINGAALSATVVGIGININQTTFPSNIPNPSSLKAITGKDYDVREIAEDLCSFIEKKYLQLRNGNQTKLWEEYKTSLYRKNKWTKYESEGIGFDAKIADIAPDGQLILLLRNGEKRKFNFKQVKLITPLS